MNSTNQKPDVHTGNEDAAAPVAPDLQELVAKYGGYNKITAEAWAQFDEQMATYQGWIRRRR